MGGFSLVCRDGHNLFPVPLNEALSMLSEMYEMFSGYVDFAVPFEKLSVQRLDTVRQFQAGEHINPLLRGLHELPLATGRAPNVGGRIRRGEWPCADEQRSLEGNSL